ncbi:MAG TPA: M1 family aminopeptidase [Candidatus Acidoferrales bacterium]|nr:M1 family aminopeptidase [Candidatus Acidoferrales bacterium]
MNFRWKRYLVRLPAAILTLAVLLAGGARADRPYAPSREYDLQNVRVALHFDIDQRKVIGDVTHTLTTLRDGETHLYFDCSELAVSSVRVNGKDATFDLRDNNLRVSLAQPAKSGEKFEVEIKYDGKPTSGLYFILPDQGNPNRAKEIWTQGEAEDTHHYIPIYDYPNDRTAFEIILTVPADWLTVSNGKLISVQDAPNAQKTWTWRQSQPVSTYLISFVAGEYQTKKDSWKNIPVTYNVPRGMGDTIDATFARTKQMLDFFSDRFGVVYPWDQYAQTAVHDFVASGMENVSATTLAARDMLHAGLAGERPEAADSLVSHELTHQWFGDLVTCKDWTNTWLNEGFATFGAELWEEHFYGLDASSYRYWRDQNSWMQSRELFSIPIVTRNIDDSVEYEGNVYDKAGWVIHMLREQMGDEAFFRALKHYLESNRMQNVVTADLVKSIEESSGTNVDRFFDQWIYGAGAPRFTVRYSYDETAKTVNLSVKQTQKVEGRVGLFRAPIDISITTASGEKVFPIEVSKASESFSFAVDGAPQIVLFDKGDKILKSVDFQKTAEEWIRQLRTASSVPDRADAAVALGTFKDNDAAVSALGDAALHDKFWGVREESLRSLGRINSPAARKQVLADLSNEQPWVRVVAVEQLGKDRGDEEVIKRLQNIFKDDKAYTVRAAALQSLALDKSSNLQATLEKTLTISSPGDVLRGAALRAMGSLGDDAVVPSLLEWSAPGKPADLRGIAIGALGRVDLKNRDITAKLISYLNEMSFDIRFATIFALGRRGDPTAIEPLEALLKTGELSIGVPHALENLIEELKTKSAQQGGPGATAPAASASASGGQKNPDAGAANVNQAVLDRLDEVEHQLADMNEKLKHIESSMPDNKND